MTYAVVLGEALVDLLDGECDGQPVFRQAIGGAPFNVAVGVARLGGAVEFAGSLGDDPLGTRILEFLTTAGVGGRGVVRKPVPTTLAVATFTGAEPEFRFYGSPPSYSLIRPADLDGPLVADAAVLYCGSIVLLHESVLATARAGWAATSGWKVFDPNVRPTLLPTSEAVDGLRNVVEEFVATADLVKMSHADAAVLYPDASIGEVASRYLDLGAGAVVVTRGAAGALVARDADRAQIPAPVVRAVDATGAGDSVMAALVAGLLRDGLPATMPDLTEAVGYALRVAGLVCERPGGAVAMPTRDEVAARFPILEV